MLAWHGTELPQSVSASLQDSKFEPLPQLVLMQSLSLVFYEFYSSLESVF